MSYVGDFHFLWECLRVIFLMFWGSPAQVGSLCNMREIIRRLQVDKGVKVFNVGDEFLIHVFKAHFKASILPVLNIQTSSDTTVASSPAPSQLFSLAGKKRERAWDLKSRDKCWQNGVALALPQSVDFRPVWDLWSIKQSSARPLRIVLPSLTVSVAFFFTRIEPESSKIALAHAQFSRSATLPTLLLGRVGAKHGLWTLDWTLDWTHGLDCGLRFGLDFGLIRSLMTIISNTVLH